MSTYLNGFRDFVGILLVMPTLRYFFNSSHAAEFRQTFDRMLKIWLYLQAFCITWQFIRYGAGDMGGGTMGEGSSGLTSMLIYTVSFYLISTRWDAGRYWHSLWENRLYIFLLYPTFLNETKISMVIFLAYFILLVKFDRNLILRLVYIVPVGLVFFVGAFFAYLSATDQEPDDYFSSELYKEYLYGLDLEDLVDVAQKVQDGKIEVDQTAIWEADLPRFGKMALLIPVLHSCPGGILFGAGIGQFKGWTTDRKPPFATEYEWLLIGSRPMAFTMLVQIGLIGLGWFVWLLYFHLFSGRGVRPLATQLRLLLAFNFLIVLAYNECFRELVFCAIMFYILQSVRTADDSQEAENIDIYDKGIDNP